MKICFVGKYPPIQGGVCVANYWMTHGLASLGHEVHVITNADEVESEYRMVFEEEDQEHLEPRFEASGGRVRLHGAEKFSGIKMEHIPRSNPFVSKLAALATQVIRREGCEIIYAHYFEPYGVAGYLASLWTGVPIVLRHAGSDLDRLMRTLSLSTTYQEILAGADGLITRPTLSHRFFPFGLTPKTVFPIIPPGAPDSSFNPGLEPLDLAPLVAVRGWNAVAARGEPGPAFDPTRPTIGIYGKVGPVKGSYDLVAALSQLREEGLDFNFIALSQGRRSEEFKRVIERSRVADRTWVLPFLPLWKVPRFNRACDAVCFLERDFPIKIHRPRVATEVLLCGTCLVLSGEIAGKQPYQEEIEDRRNVLLVEDPKDHDELARQLRFVIENPQCAAEIGRAGRDLVGGLAENYAKCAAGHQGIFERVLGDDEAGRTLADDISAAWSEKAGEPSSSTPEPIQWLDHLMPWIRVLLPEAFDDLARRALAETPLATERPKLYATAATLCRLLAADLEAGRHDTSGLPFLPDLVRLVSAKCEICYGGAEGPAVLFDGIDQLSGARLEMEKIAPLVIRSVRRFRFLELDWDVTPLAGDRLGFFRVDDAEKWRQSLIDAVEPRRSTLFLFQTPNGRPGQLKIGPSTRELIEQVHRQPTTAGELFAALARGRGAGEEQQAFEADFVSALQMLYSSTAIIFDRPPERPYS